MIIEPALRESGGECPAELGIPRSTPESKIAYLKIDKHRFKTTNPQQMHLDVCLRDLQNARLRNSQICEHRNLDLMLSR